MLKHKVKPTDKVTVCPGPNLAYFSKISTLKEMVDHIYGRLNLLDKGPRPHMFMKELSMYLDIFKERIDGVNYYKDLFTEKKKELLEELDKMLKKYPVIDTEL